MRPWIAIWLALVGAHAALIAVGWVAGRDWLAPVVVGSIYLPLWPLGKLGLPVIRLSGSFLPFPTIMGWAAIAIGWSLVYGLVAAAIAWLLRMRKPGKRQSPS